MIGDWVRVSETMQVTDIVTDHREMLYGVSCTDGATYDDGDLQPVPLTAEILDMNFIEGKDRGVEGLKEWYYKDDNNGDYVLLGIIDVDNAPVAISARHAGMGIVTLSVRYVHELQHTLRLCGIEKEIEL